MNRYPRAHVKTALLLATVLAVVISTPPARETSKTLRVPISLAPSASYPATNAEPDADLASESANEAWTRLTIKSGDNLSRIFKRRGLRAADLQAIVDIGGEVSVLKRILPGRTLELRVNANGELTGLRYARSRMETLTVLKQGGEFTAERIQLDAERITAFQTARIDAETPSLYHAGKKAGLSDKVVMQLSYIFQWDISFALDIRQGDSFALLYEEIYVDGEKVKDGKILAAAFVNMGETHVAVRYQDKDGREDYYAPDGMSLRKAFLRDPVHFSHVSSRFNLRRLHPIHKRVMPHRGIDYAANRGTPVVSSGDGKVTIVRQNSASGKYVVVQHGEQYTTKYLHLSRFAKGIRAGATITQGQTVGYVGATGWATAPHLHYEFLVHGIHRNPRTVRLPKADPIPASDTDHFKRTTARLLVQLAAIQGKTGFASLEAEDADAAD